VSTDPRTSGDLVRGSTQRLPTFLIVGAPKAGTTSLALWLADHSDVYMAPEKELYYFGYNFDRGLDWYRAHFAGATSEGAVGEATPWYLYSADAAAHMASVVPDARLIAILRHPVDRAYSHFWMQRWKMPSRKGFQHLVDRASGKAAAPTRFLDVGLYLPQLQRMCDHYPRESLLILLFEDLASDPQGTFSRVCEFIGVNPGEPPASVGRAFNRGGTYRSDRIHRRMKRADLWRRSPRLARAIVRLNRASASYPPMEPEARRVLIEWYAEHNDALGEWLGRDLSAWSA
jgi:hypothetical protein